MMNGTGSRSGSGTEMGQYRKFLLNRLTTSPQFSSFLQTELARDDEHSRHFFHKIMVHNWIGEGELLYAALAERYGAPYVPVRFTSDTDFCHFYTDSLSFVQKVISSDFMFPHKRAMFNMDVLFADRTSEEMFGSDVTTEQLVSGVVSRRLSNTLELDLHALCSDPELREKDIHMYSLAQLTLYKRLMLRMGRDTKILNLSKNNLTQVPQEVMNFFMRGELIGVNLSDNNIESLEKLPRMSSLLERLWLEGNPLCEEEDAISYVKKLSVLFPRLQELDGVAVNRHGFAYPFVRNYLASVAARGLTEKFLTLFFSHYDSSPRSDMSGFYHPDHALLSISTSLTEAQLKEAKHFRTFARNLLQHEGPAARKKLYTRPHVFPVFKQLPETVHDPTTFTVDVLQYARSLLLVTVDGVFKERRAEFSESRLRIYQFRRTFYIRAIKTQYYICNELLHINAVSEDMVRHAFNTPVRKLNELSLVEPVTEDTRQLAAAFAHLTHLKPNEVERRLKVQNWDMRKALLVFQDELKSNRIDGDMFADPALDELTDDDLD